MDHFAIEINDVGLLAADSAGVIPPASPGFALLDRRDIVSGEAARALARLKPRFVSHRHWDRLTTESVGRPFPRGLSHADLVHAHLSAYWTELRGSRPLDDWNVSVLLAVPGSYSAAQLGLLLGIARAIEIPVTGLVDAALAAHEPTAAEPAETTLVLDLLRHRALWTVVDSDARVVHRHTESVESAGLAHFERKWTAAIADRFVTETRFDPLHRGASEQELYDRLHGWARQIADAGNAELSLDSKVRSHSVEIQTRYLADATASELQAIATGARRLAEDLDGDVEIALSSRAADLPGLEESLAELTPRPPRRLAEGAAALGALRHRERIESPGHELPLVLDLPLPGPILEPHG